MCSFPAWGSVSSSRNDVVNMRPAFPHPQLLRADPVPPSRADRPYHQDANGKRNRDISRKHPMEQTEFESVNNIGSVVVSIYGAMI